MTGQPLVSVVMPAYNASSYIEEAIRSVVDQTYPNGELIVVDDGSTDGTLDIAMRLAGEDGRIRVIPLSGNGGAACARNHALARCSGGAIAYLDADDVWLPEKLERQVAFMREVSCPMSFTSYETIDAQGNHRNYVHVPAALDYEGYLKNTVTCGHTAVFDLDQVDIEWLKVAGRPFDFPDDLCAWLSVLKRGGVARGLDEVLAKNRKHGASRSADKRRAVRRTWNQYRRIEGMGFAKSAYCLFWQLFHAVKKRM